MFISCDCSIEYEEIADIDSSKMCRARKAHECVECQRTIEPGELYEIWTQLREGDWRRWKTCLGCVRIRDHLSPHGWVWGNLAAQVAECIGFNYVTESET